LVAQGCLLLLGGLAPSVSLIALAAFAFMATGPIINGCNHAIWQSKVDLDVQGRVFAVGRMIASSTPPLAALLAGPLADQVFGPLLVPGGALADTFLGRLIGVGPGRGIGLLFIVLGALVLLIVSVSFLNPRLRRVESEVPDAPRETPESRNPEGERRLQNA
ncbi:MAG TPA: MFS transporter, partial [Thermoanaerobaculia bacterium]|nr:MFS transporter [Thermoanaerobaculia bacterium]